MVKAIIFDADGPLYYRTADVAEQKTALLEKFGCPDKLKAFEDAYKKERFKAYTGSKTPDAMFQQIFSRVGCQLSSDDAGRFTEAFGKIHSQVTAVDDAASTLKNLKDQGYKTCILTDSFYSAEEKWHWLKMLGMDTLIDHIVSSYDIRKLKDTPEAYQTCLDALEITADEAIFVGHQEYEMVGAKQIGIASVAVLPISPPDISADYTIESLSELPGLLQQIF